MMNRLPTLRLSVVIVTNTTLNSLWPIITALAQQTITKEIELIVVGPELNEVDLNSRLGSVFGAVKALSIGPIANRGRAAAAGVLAASAPFVALTENHCFPKRDWAECLLESYREKIAAVGPSVSNANPDSLLSWATYALGYARFHPKRPAGARDVLPLHNSSYRTAALKPFGNKLHDFLADEHRLMSELRSVGATLWFEPRANTRHINEARWPLVVPVMVSIGWRYAGWRARSWTIWRRSLYALAWPFLSLPIAKRLLSALRTTEAAPRLSVGVAIHVWLVALAFAAGEALGYITRSPHSLPWLERDEFLINERLGKGQVLDSDLRDLLAKLD